MAGEVGRGWGGVSKDGGCSFLNGTLGEARGAAI